jgi:DeoR/GlpR family transcriptional regulator of sugar metabolism
MKDRISQILTLLTQQQKMEVSAIAQALGVSQVTVRKYLDSMEQRGIIKREHGYAVLSSTNDIAGRMAFHYEEKRKIAMKAAQLVHDGDTIMIESGSCCALLAEILTSKRKNLTILTNSAFIADYIRNLSNFEIVLFGGTYQQDSQVMVGPMVSKCAEDFRVDLFFIGVDGYSERVGFTNQDQMRAQAVRDMAKQTERVVVLTESEKFNRHGTVPLNLKDQVGTVITDDQMEPQMADHLKGQGIELLFA